MDSIIEISKLVGFDSPDEIIKTLKIVGGRCVDLNTILNSPILPPLSYTDDCMRFVALLRYWRGKEIAKECAKAYRVVKGCREKEEFWWGVQELLYRMKVKASVINRYLRRLRRRYRSVLRARRRIERIISDWILPPYVELFSGLLPPMKGVRLVGHAVDSVLKKSGQLSRFGISTFDVIHDLFERLYVLLLKDESPKSLFENAVKFVDVYLGLLEMSLVCRKDSVDPPFDFTLGKDAY